MASDPPLCQCDQLSRDWPALSAAEASSKNPFDYLLRPRFCGKSCLHSHRQIWNPSLCPWQRLPLRGHRSLGLDYAAVREFRDSPAYPSENGESLWTLWNCSAPLPGFHMVNPLSLHWTWFSDGWPGYEDPSIILNLCWACRSIEHSVICGYKGYGGGLPISCRVFT